MKAKDIYRIEIYLGEARIRVHADDGNETIVEERKYSLRSPIAKVISLLAQLSAVSFEMYDDGYFK